MKREIWGYVDGEFVRMEVLFRFRCMTLMEPEKGLRGLLWSIWQIISLCREKRGMKKKRVWVTRNDNQERLIFGDD